MICSKCGEEVVLVEPPMAREVIHDREQVRGECGCSSLFYYEEGGWCREGPREEKNGRGED